MMKKRKVISLVAAVTVVAALGIGATLAYFTAQAEQTNVVTMGHVDCLLYTSGISKTTRMLA